LKDTDSNEYVSADLHTFIKNKFIQMRNNKMLEEHPDLELTKFSPEIDWKASLWPIHGNNDKHESLTKFQYKLKSKTLLTPALRFQRNISSKNLPVPLDSQCTVCNNSAQDADLTHIFTQCTVASEHNKVLWDLLKPIQDTVQLSTQQSWITINQESLKCNKVNTIIELGDDDWDTTFGDLGYIPSFVTKQLNPEQLHELRICIANSRHNLWKDYWNKAIKFAQIQQTSHSACTSTPATPPSVGEPPPSSGQHTQSVVVISPSLDLLEVDSGASNIYIRKKTQTTLSKFFKKL
jgi:hypothetical protein